jgi:hypothetical protein
MKTDHVNTLIADIRDCAKRAGKLGYFQRAEALNQIASDMEQMSGDRASIPPIDNQSARATAGQHFKAARRLLKDIIK